MLDSIRQPAGLHYAGTAAVLFLAFHPHLPAALSVAVSAFCISLAAAQTYPCVISCFTDPRPAGEA